MLPYVRCTVTGKDPQFIYATAGEEPLRIDYSNDPTIFRIVREGMQLNLLDSTTSFPSPLTLPSPTGGVGGGSSLLTPSYIIVEPDFLVDISAVARCFLGEYGHHPLHYTLNRLRPRPNTQAILLGNFAGDALDDIVHSTDADGYDVSQTLRRSFSEQALQFCACKGFNGKVFNEDARRQAANIREVSDLLFQPGNTNTYDRGKVLLEPSFVCERLGLQGRVDLMTTDLRLLIEQKSGRGRKQEHYVQLLLYYGVLRYNFDIPDHLTATCMLYSYYPAAQGLLHVPFQRQLFREALQMRNQIVGTELLIARESVGRILPQLTEEVIYKNARRDGFFHERLAPQLSHLTSQFSTLTPLERAYYERMLTFVYREQLAAKLEVPASDRYTGLRVVSCDKTDGATGYDLITLALDDTVLATEQCPDFRRGDIVYLYAYEGEPHVHRAILYKGVLHGIGVSRIVVKLNDSQQTFDSQGVWAVEHGSSDISWTSAIRCLHQFITSHPDKRALLLGQRTPRADLSKQLSQSYHPHYDEVITRALQARDYFLLIGPPGTGKTSMALRYIVSEELFTLHSSLLLMAYTNRAVDEICAMLSDAGFDYVRFGNEASCDPAYHDHLFRRMATDGTPRLDDLRQRLRGVRIVVCTTLTAQLLPLTSLFHFSLAVIDEASQLLEPGIIGLLASDSIDRFILIGDHKQLPAVVQQPAADSVVSNSLLLDAGITDCRQSLFERLLRHEQRCGRTQFVGVLHYHGRMHPDIAAFPTRMFYAREQLLPAGCPHQTAHTLPYLQVTAADHLDGLLMKHRVLFFDTSMCPSLSEPQMVADLLRRTRRFYGNRFDADKSVGIIVPYRFQIGLIRQELGDDAELSNVTIDTVERYQGSQRDVIIYSFTATEPEQLDFLTANCFEETDGHTIDRKLNVVMTRARCQLLMTGYAPLLRRNPLFAQLIDEYGAERVFFRQ